MATNANVDWGHPAPAKYVPAFGSGSYSTAQSADDAHVSYLLRGDATPSNSRLQEGAAEDDDTSNEHPGSQTQTQTTSAVKPNENLTSEDPRMGFMIPPTKLENLEQRQHPWSTSHSELPEYTRGVADYYQMHERERRQGPVKSKPDPSHPRLFRPFALNEEVDTMTDHWRLPPIMGSYLLFPNKKVKYNPIPPKLEFVREKIFRMEEPILLKNSQEVADYTPHITNLWRHSVQRYEVCQNGLQVEYWHCRSKQRRKHAFDKVRGPPKGIRNREKKFKALFGQQPTCQMRLRVTSFTRHADTPGDHSSWGHCKCVPEWVHFKRACVDRELTEHTHEQEILERYKHSEGISVLTKLKVEEGNSSASVVKWLKKECGDRLKEAYRFDKVDVANYIKLWRAQNPDLVLREEVPEDSEEMTTMRRCVDAILEADAGPLRAALREVCKDSHDVTKRALAVLEKKASEKSAPRKEEAQEPWKLTEGAAAISNVSLPGQEELKKNYGSLGPLEDSLETARAFGMRVSAGRAGVFVPIKTLGPPPNQDTRPSVPHLAPAPSQQQPQQQPPQQLSQQLSQQPQHQPQHQPQQTMPGVQPHAQSAPLAQAPRNQTQHSIPTSTGQMQPTQQPPQNVEIRYIYVQQPPPPPPRTYASVHNITVSLEIPSCRSSGCQQCTPLEPRNLRGRTFFFQGRLHSEAHFLQLQALLRNPMQILNEGYSGILSKDARTFMNPVERPPGSNEQPGQPEQPPSTTPTTTPSQHPPQQLSQQPPQHVPQYHHHPGVVPHPQPQPLGMNGQSHSAQYNQSTAQARTQAQYHNPPGQTAPGQTQAGASQMQAQPPGSEAAPRTSHVSESPLAPTRNGGSDYEQRQDHSPPISIYDQPLPVPMSRPREDDGEDDGEEPPAKRQRQQPRGEQYGDEQIEGQVQIKEEEVEEGGEVDEEGGHEVVAEGEGSEVEMQEEDEEAESEAS